MHQPPTVIKPTDGCNFMMAALVARDSGNRALFIYSTLEEFIVSVLRYSPRHQWVRLRAQELLLDARRKGGMVCQDPSGLSLAQLAALVWSRHTGEYIESTIGAGRRYASLCADDLVADPVPAVVSLCRYFSLPVDDDTVREAVSQAETDVNAKARHERFDANDRNTAYNATRESYGKDIDNALSWAEMVFSGRDLAAALPRSLSAVVLDDRFFRGKSR